MHPSISKFSRRAYYSNKLRDAPAVLDRAPEPWHAPQYSGYLGPYTFIDVRHGCEERHSGTQSIR
jgi:superfamily I DNA and/or RNA helicase